MNNPRVLISGAGIAGLTLATLLRQRGFAPLVVERNSEPSGAGYMMDFFGTGWDVAERMNLVDDLKTIHYPIERLDFVDRQGAVFHSVAIDRIRKALGGRYAYLRRSDLEAILLKRARECGVEIRFGDTIRGIEQRTGSVAAAFESGDEDEYALVFGADGVHSNVRGLVFGDENNYAKFLGYYVAAFRVPTTGYGIGNALKLYEVVDRGVWIYPLNDRMGDAVFIFRHDALNDPPEQRLALLRQEFRDAGWIASDILNNVDDGEPIFFDSLTEIVMPQWHRGRVALLGDACGCLTLAAGQGSHMAMAGAYVLAEQLGRTGNHDSAFAAYQRFLMPHVERKQRDAAAFARMIVPDRNSYPALRRLIIRLLFSAPVLPLFFRYFGASSVLPPLRH